MLLQLLYRWWQQSRKLWTRVLLLQRYRCYQWKELSHYHQNKDWILSYLLDLTFQIAQNISHCLYIVLQFYRKEGFFFFLLTMTDQEMMVLWKYTIKQKATVPFISQQSVCRKLCTANNQSC
jgi:hypothetical protein